MIDISEAVFESVWLEANKFYDAESRYYKIFEIEHSKQVNPSYSPCLKRLHFSSLTSEISFVVQKIQSPLTSDESDIHINSIEDKLEEVKKKLDVLQKQTEILTSQLNEVIPKLSIIKNLIRQGTSQARENFQIPKKELHSTCSESY